MDTLATLGLVRRLVVKSVACIQCAFYRTEKVVACDKNNSAILPLQPNATRPRQLRRICQDRIFLFFDIGFACGVIVWYIFLLI